MKLGRVQGKVTVREHLTRVWRATGRKPKELDHGDCPAGFDLVWSWFCRLSRRRAVGMAVSPVTHQDIAAFCAVNGLSIAPWQAQLIESLDDLWMAQHG